MLRLSKLLVVLSLISSIGLQWSLLQSVAWIGMIVDYSRDASIGKALEKTFDGQHPCCLCKMIQKGRDAEKKQDQQQTKSSLKLNLGLVWQTITFNFASNRQPIPSTDSHALPWREAPPKPRPRSV